MMDNSALRRGRTRLAVAAPVRGLWAVVLAGVLLAWVASAALALNGSFPDVRTLTPAGITIDGSQSDWDGPPPLTKAQNAQLDRMGPLYLGPAVSATGTPPPGSFTQIIVGDVYARYDCTSQTLFVRLHARDAETGRDLSVATGSGSFFQVGPHTVNQDAATFKFIPPSGWEASFDPLPTGTYSFTAHAIVNRNGEFFSAVFNDAQQVRVGADCTPATATPATATPATATPATATPATATPATATPATATPATATPATATPATATPVVTPSPSGSVGGATGTPATPAPTPTPSGSVGGATGSPHRTPPPTTSAPTGGGAPSIPLVLAALAILTAVFGILTPSRRASRGPRRD